MAQFMYASRAFVFTGNSCPVRVLKTCFIVAPLAQGGGIGFLGSGEC